MDDCLRNLTVKTITPLYKLQVINLSYIYHINIVAPRMIDVNIDGDGILADLYKTIIQTFKPVAKEMNMDTMSCLPNPWPPNYDCYQRISNIKN